MSKEKRLQKEKRILQDSRRSTHFTDNRYKWGDVIKILNENKIELQDDDILEVGFVEGWDEGDSSRDDAFDLTVIRTREENDEEYERRMDKKKNTEKFHKEQRYKNYLKLKEEFDGIH